VLKKDLKITLDPFKCDEAKVYQSVKSYLPKADATVLRSTNIQLVTDTALNGCWYWIHSQLIGKLGLLVFQIDTADTHTHTIDLFHVSTVSIKYLKPALKAITSRLFLKFPVTRIRTKLFHLKSE
jgi:hypothetical protein